MFLANLSFGSQDGFVVPMAPEVMLCFVGENSWVIGCVTAVFECAYAPDIIEMGSGMLNPDRGCDQNPESHIARFYLSDPIAQLPGGHYTLEEAGK